MALYRFRCPEHGDFLVEQPMAETTRYVSCPRTCGVTSAGFVTSTGIPYCHQRSPKVLSAHLHFHGGRDAFRDGVEGTGETGRETRDRWMSEAKAAGVELEPAGARWV